MEWTSKSSSEYSILIGDYAVPSFVSSNSSLQSIESTAEYPRVFWSQFSRRQKSKKKSLLSLLKDWLIGKRVKRRLVLPTSEPTTYLVNIPTHPVGLYCVIEDFLATYSGYPESRITSSDEYGEVVDALEKQNVEENEYSEILGYCHYQNLSELFLVRSLKKDNIYR